MLAKIKIGLTVSLALTTAMAISANFSVKKGGRPLSATIAQNDSTGRLVVTLSNVGQAFLPIENAQLVFNEIGRLTGQSIKVLSRLGAGRYQVEVSGLNSANASAISKQISGVIGVSSSEIVRKAHAFNFDDPNWSTQEGYLSGSVASTDGLNSGISDMMKRFPTLGSNVNVAVIDSGLGSNDDDNGIFNGFLNLVEENSSSVDEKQTDAADETCEDGFSSTPYHGQQVSGVIGAVRGNKIGVTGILSTQKITHIKALGRCGSDAEGTLDVATAIMWAAGVSDLTNDQLSSLPANPNPAKVINLSLGSSEKCPSFMQDAVNKAIAAGAHVVAAVGNGSFLGMNAPANCAGVFSVGANTVSGFSESYSNISSETVTSTIGGGGQNPVVTLTSTTVSPDGLARVSGTSFAAPHVAAILAMAVEATKGSKTNSDLLSAVKASNTRYNTSDINCGAVNDQGVGSCGGILNATAFLNLVAPSLFASTVEPAPQPVTGTKTASQLDMVRIDSVVTGSDQDGSSVALSSGSLSFSLKTIGKVYTFTIDGQKSSNQKSQKVKARYKIEVVAQQDRSISASVNAVAGEAPEVEFEASDSSNLSSVESIIEGQDQDGSTVSVSNNVLTFKLQTVGKSYNFKVTGRSKQGVSAKGVQASSTDVKTFNLTAVRSSDDSIAVSASEVTGPSTTSGSTPTTPSASSGGSGGGGGGGGSFGFLGLFALFAGLLVYKRTTR
ncbi:MAG: S8 family serine peptidase [Limnobacter sp.]|uniref:S8 family serine peptidase n=1 Tax=Limnobacter sp. TaxID=2003368 RepID=UPI00391D22AC